MLLIETIYKLHPSCFTPVLYIIFISVFFCLKFSSILYVEKINGHALLPIGAVICSVCCLYFILPTVLELDFGVFPIDFPLSILKILLATRLLTCHIEQGTPVSERAVPVAIFETEAG